MPIPSVPPPWTLRADVYLFPWWTSASSVRAGLPPVAYSPLEAGSSFARPSESGRPVGGVSMVQVLRYRDSPVGAYDEMLVIPGGFEYAREEDGEGGGNGRRVVRRGPRVTRIYVSGRDTCYNGRRNWNIPKHLARFVWTDHDDGSTSVQVYPHDNPSSSVPFFQTTFTPWRLAPAFPLSTTWVNLVGIDSVLVQPPLPAGGRDELPGTERWCAVSPGQYSLRAVFGTFDVQQQQAEGGGGAAEGDGQEETREKNFWPGLGRWRYGVKMEDARVSFGECEDTWDAPRSGL